jgi:hypothetical protein
MQRKQMLNEKLATMAKGDWQQRQQNKIQRKLDHQSVK